MTTTKQVIKNASFLSAAYVGQKLLSFIYFTLIARVVGVIDTGAYVFALSYSTICSVFVDFGLSQLLQREIAKHPDRSESLLSSALRLKLGYAAATVVVGLAIFSFVSESPQLWNMVLIAMGIMLLDSYALTIWAAFRGKHMLSYESMSIVVSQIIVLTVGVTGLYLRARLEVLLLALMSGSLWTAVYATVKFHKQFGYWPHVGGREARQLAKESITFGIASTFSRLFASLDSVLLGQLVGAAAVGFYAIPNKFVFAAQFIPAAISASLYPALSSLHGRDEKQMRALFFQAISFLYVLAAPMAVGLFLLTPDLIHSLYTPAYAPSIPAMQIMVWGLVFGFMEYPFGALIAAIGQQQKNSITRVTVVVVNVTLNLLLIPSYSFLGTAFAAVASYGLLTGMGAFWTRKIWLQADRSFVMSLVKVTVSTLLMAVAVVLVQPYAHFVVLALLGVIVYAACVIGMRVVDVRDVPKFFAQFRKREPEMV